MQMTAWPCVDNTGSSSLVVNRPGIAWSSCCSYSGCCIACRYGKVLLALPSSVPRQDMGYALVQLRPSERESAPPSSRACKRILLRSVLFSNHRFQKLRVFSVFPGRVFTTGCLARSLHRKAWKELDDLARAADLFLAEGMAGSSYLFKTKAGKRKDTDGYRA